MRLEFRQQHLSIRAFPAIDLPKLSIIVGLNGSGKSHLLQAIQNGSVSNSVVPLQVGQGMPSPGPINAQTSPIKLLAQSEPVADVNSQYTSNAPGSPQPMPMMYGPDQFPNHREGALIEFRKRLYELCPPGSEVNVLHRNDVWPFGAERLIEEFGRHEVAAEIRELYEQAEAHLLQPGTAPQGGFAGPGPNTLDAARIISRQFNIPMLSLQPEHLKLYERWGEIDPFSVNLPMIFGRYRDARLRNWMLQKADAANGTGVAITDEQFFERFGPPPWQLINDTLKSFGLPYEVTGPAEYEYSPVSVSFKKIPGGEQVQLLNLSSGERVLTQFAISTFQYDEAFLSVRRPQLLLLDEMDASLHPEMVARWLGAIKSTLVDGQGMHCIVTTHSPTTVALAPEDALFEMTDGLSGLAPISKQDALNKLTFGVPTLSINYSGRRQVFAESDTDAAIFESVYALIKADIACVRELNFLSTGMRDKDNGEINAGCTIVKGTVERLAELGNTSIFGIVDWDGEAVSTDRIKVIAEGRRDGIENVLLDPLLVCLLLVKERKTPEGLEDIDRFVGAERLDAANLQRLVDAIQKPLFPEATDTVEVKYLGGATCNVLRAYLEADDHTLEDALCDRFPPLKQWHRKGKGHGTLVKTVIEHVLAEHTCFCPTEIRDTFETIANAPV